MSITCGQRVQKLQPLGGFDGLGTSPVRMMRSARRLEARVGFGHRRQQRLGVGMLRVVVKRVAVGQFDDLAQVHHRDPVGDVAHHRQVVADEQVGQAELLLQVLQQVHDLRLDRHVQRRDRLVADDELGVQRQRAGDADALALAAGELVRIAVGEVAVQADRIQQLVDPVALFGLGQPGVFVQRLADDARPPSCAGSGWPAGPGTPSAWSGASCAGRPAPAWP